MTEPDNTPHEEAVVNEDQTDTPQNVQIGSFQHSKRKFQVWQLAVFGIIFGALGAYALLQTFATPPNKGGSTPPPPLSFTQNWQARYPDRGINAGCFGVDDAANWQGNGTLAAGASYTFTPSYPTCGVSELPMIAMHVGWSGTTQVKLESTYPFFPALVGTQQNVGQHILAPLSADSNSTQQANLCLWGDAGTTAFNQGLNSNTTTFPWTMTITNTGSQTATVTASGYEANGWEMNIYPGCKRADGDNDHWNDSLEMVMMSMGNRTTGDANTRTSYEGSNYVAASGTATPNDEYDFSPADFNDDGVINQTDVNTVTGYLGQGDDISIDQLSPNNTDTGYVNNEAQTWRRYDIDGDGRVSQNDIDWVKGLVGQPLPLTSDPLNPWAVIHANTAHANTTEYVYAYAVDNDLLTHVDFYSTISGKQKLLCQTWGANQPTHVPNANNDEFSCPLTTPRQVGASVLLTVKAYDNAGHSYTTTKTLATQ